MVLPSIAQGALRVRPYGKERRLLHWQRSSAAEKIARAKARKCSPIKKRGGALAEVACACNALRSQLGELVEIRILVLLHEPQLPSGARATVGVCVLGVAAALEPELPAIGAR